MNDVVGGVYRSRIGTSDWEPDEDVGGLAHMLFDHGDTKAGLWKAFPKDDRGTVEVDRGTVEVEIPARETLLILEGDVRVTIDRRETHALQTGDMLSIPAGALVGWDPSPDCKVFWIYS